jgi:predicted secreted protein
MAAVQHARGVKLLLKVESQDSPNQYAAFCTINAARGITFTSATNEFNIPDCTDPDLIGWLAREKVSLSVAVTGAGILNTPDVQDFFDWWSSSESRNCQIVVDVVSADGGVIFAGLFHLTEFAITGDRGAKMEATLTLASDGAVTSTPNT